MDRWWQSGDVWQTGRRGRRRNSGQVAKINKIYIKNTMLEKQSKAKASKQTNKQTENKAK